MGLLAAAVLLGACGGGGHQSEDERSDASAGSGIGDQQSAPDGAAETWVVHEGGMVCGGGQARPGPGRDVYVSNDGDDANPGTDIAPLRTLAASLCNVGPGQTVNVLPGVYEESVLMTGFDFDDRVSIVGVDGPDGRPVIDGAGERTMGLALIESGGFAIENLEFRNFTDEGLLVTVAEDVIVRGNRFVDNGFAGIDPDSDGEGFGFNADGVRNLLVEGNEAAGNGPSRERWEDSVLGMGINTFDIHDAVIRDNYVHDTVGGGILVEDSTGVIVAGNVVTDNELDANGDYWDGGVWVDGGGDVTVRDNVLADNHGPGLQVSDEDDQGPTGYVLEGNVLRGNLWGVYVWNFSDCPWPAVDVIRATGNQMSNNSRGDHWCIP